MPFSLLSYVRPEHPEIQGVIPVSWPDSQ